MLSFNFKGYGPEPLGGLPAPTESIARSIGKTDAIIETPFVFGKTEYHGP
jgi:hypothetical protein